MIFYRRFPFLLNAIYRLYIGCGRQNNASSFKDARVLIPEPRVHVTLYGKRDFASVIKLRVLNRNIVLG